MGNSCSPQTPGIALTGLTLLCDVLAMTRNARPGSAIDIEGLSFRIGRQEILKGIDLTVAAGEYVSVIGPNGAGKTTLLKCVLRILRGGEGRIRVFGRPLTAYHQHELAREVAYVPQAGGTVFPFTVHDLVLMGRYPHLSPFSLVGPEDHAAVHRALQLTGMESFEHRTLDTLSGGERQKAMIAAALAQQARILLLDEPLTFLDPHHQAEVFAILRRINTESRVTVLSVTHDVNTAVRSSTMIYALREGAAVYSGPADGILKNDVLERIYGTRFHFLDHPFGGNPVLIPEGME